MLIAFIFFELFFNMKIYVIQTIQYLSYLNKKNTKQKY
jgi:hypothetical protein